MKLDVYGTEDLRNQVITYCGDYELEFHMPGNPQFWAKELVRGLLSGIKHVAKHGSVFDDLDFETDRVLEATAHVNRT